MTTQTEHQKKNSNLEILSQLFAVSAASIGLNALLGWFLGLPILATLGSLNVPMAPSTALLFALFGAALFFRLRYPMNRKTYFIGLFVGVLIEVCALLLSYFSIKGIHSDIEHLGFSIANSLDKITIGHMSPLTAICFVVSALALLLSLSQSHAGAKRLWASLLMAVLVFFTALILLIAYLLETPLLYNTTIIPPSLPASLAILFLSMSLLVGAVLQFRHFNRIKNEASSLGSTFLLLIFILFTAVIITGSAIVYQSFKMNLRSEIENQLSAISELKVNQLTQWRKERIADGRLFYKNVAFTASVKLYRESKNDRDAKKSLMSWMRQIQKSYSYNMVLLLDPKLNSLLRYPENEKPVQAVVSQKEIDSLLSGNIVFQDFYRNPQDHKVYLNILIPILEERSPKKIIAVLMFRISPKQYLFSLFNMWPVPSKTSEILIVRKDSTSVTFLNDLKFYDNSVLNLMIPLTKKDVLAVKAVTGNTGIVEGIDYRGKEVIGYVRSVPELPWFIVSRTDKEEVFAPLNEKLWEILIIAVLLLSSSGAGVGFVLRYQQNRYYKEQLQLMENVNISEMRYRRLFEAARDGILILDAETGMVVDVNPFLIELLGLTKEVFFNRKVWELGFLNDAIANEDNFKELKEKGHVRYEDMALEAHNGERRKVEFVSNVYIVDNKKVIQCNIRDISERKRAEEALRKSEEQYRLLFNEMLSGFAVHEIICDQSGTPTDYRFVSVNKAFEKMTGLNASDILGKTVLEVIPGTESSWIARYGKVALTGEPTQFENYAVALGKYYEVRAYCTKHGTFATLINDITERKKLNDELSQTMILLEHAGEKANLGGWELDVGSGRLIMSKEVARIHEVDASKEQLSVSEGDEYYSPEVWPVVRNAVQAAIEQGTAYDLEVPFITAKGNHIWVHITGFAVRENGKTVKLRGLFQEITERKQAQEKIKKLNSELETRVIERTTQLDLSNKELTAFSYSVSHDLRAPLRAIDGFSLALLEDYAPKLDEQGKENLQRIRAATQRMGCLIDDLLSLSRVGQLELKRKNVNLSSIAQEIANELQKNDPDRDVEFVITPDLTASGDKQLLNIVLTNLMQNAFKFTSRHAKARVEFGVTAHNGTRTYFVRDDGAGFDMKIADKLFGAFQRMHSTIEFSGTGIGLATVYRIINRHGGRVWAESEVEKGATFYFTL